MYEVIIGTVIFLVTAFLVFVGDKYFLKKPKITLTIKTNSNHSSSSDKPNHIKIKWEKYFLIKNLTKCSAYNIHFYNLPPNITTHNEINNLDGFKETQINFSFAEDIKKEKVILPKDKFVDLLPDYFKELSFCIEYENEHRKKFYTLYKKNNEVEQNKFYFRNVCK